MKSKNAIILLIFALMMTHLHLSAKIIESSSATAPAWVEKGEKDFVVATASAADRNGAESLIQQQVQLAIINEVIETMAARSKKSGEGLKNAKDNFRSFIEVRTDKIEYLKGVKKSKLADSYWERTEDERGKESFKLVAKYPLPAADIEKMIANYTEFNKQKYDELKSYESKIAEISSVEQIDTALTNISLILSYLFNVEHHQEAIAIQKQYYDLYSQIKIETINSVIGREEMKFTLNGKTITTDQQPTMDGGKVKKMSFDIADADKKSYVLTYDYLKCKSGKESLITLTFKFGSVQLTHRILFDVADYMPSIQITDDISLRAGIRDRDHASSIDIRIPIRVYKCDKLAVSSVVLHVPGVAGPIAVSNIGQVLEGRDSYILQIRYPGRVQRAHDGSGGNINRFVTLYITGTMNDAVPLSESFTVNCHSNW